MTVPLDLHFKGDRNYIRGTDFFESISKSCSAKMGGFLQRLAFKRLTRNQCDLVFDQTGTIADSIARGTWKTGDGRPAHFLLVETERPVTKRYPYDEEPIRRLIRISNKEASMPFLREYSTIEAIVATTKFLNQRLNPPLEKAWLFGQIDLTCALPETWEYIQVKQFISSLGLFSRSKLFIDGVEIGEIRFIQGAA